MVQFWKVFSLVVSIILSIFALIFALLYFTFGNAFGVFDERLDYLDLDNYQSIEVTYLGISDDNPDSVWVMILYDSEEMDEEVTLLYILRESYDTLVENGFLEDVTIGESITVLIGGYKMYGWDSFQDRYTVISIQRGTDVYLAENTGYHDIVSYIEMEVFHFCIKTYFLLFLISLPIQVIVIMVLTPDWNNRKKDEYETFTVEGMMGEKFIK